MTDETLLTSTFSSARAPKLYVPSGDEGALPAAVWKGLLGEFRNQLERLNAGTVQLRDALPVGVGGEVAPALSDMEASLDGLFGLVACLDAVTTGDAGQQVISDIGDVIDRAIAMASPWLRADVQVSVGSRVGAVRNRGRAVECALAAVVINLARPDDARLGPGAREMHVGVFSSRGAITIEIETDGALLARPTSSSSFSPSSWRWRLAERLAVLAGGSLEPLADRAGVGLRFQ